MVTDRLRIGVPGAAGRMGATLIKMIRDADGAELVAATETVGHAALGNDAGVLAGLGPLGVPISDDPAAMFSAADAVLDFTLPAATARHAELAASHKASLVIGTTGLGAAQQAALNAASAAIPIVQAPNMSLCVNLLFRLAEQVAAALDEDYDIEIVEMHHRHKVDAPSGTAMGLGRAAASGRGVKLDDVAISGRDGITGERERGSIGFAALRGGDVVGDHTVMFAAEGERLELTHKSSSRLTYARGALAAARWAVGREPGLYSMTDVMGLNT